MIPYIPGKYGPSGKIQDSRDCFGHAEHHAGYGMIRPSPNVPPIVKSKFPLPVSKVYVPGEDASLEDE